MQTPANWSRWAEGVITRDQAVHAYQKAVESMARLNRNGARLMHKYAAHGATVCELSPSIVVRFCLFMGHATQQDVTGFGFLGHARNLARNQRAAVNFELHTLPVLAHMLEVDAHVSFFKLRAGFSAETSGGLLLALPAAAADAFCHELQQLDGHAAWIVGRVVPNPSGDRASNTADIVSAPTIVTV